MHDVSGGAGQGWNLCLAASCRCCLLSCFGRLAVAEYASGSVRAFVLLQLCCCSHTCCSSAAAVPAFCCSGLAAAQPPCCCTQLPPLPSVAALVAAEACCCYRCVCRYLLLCAPGSKVQQCVDQPPIRQLKPPMQYYSAVQRLCNGTSTATGTGDAAAGSGAVANASLELDLNSEDAAAVAAACRTCSAMSDDPTKVVVQATQANCPDPLGE